MAHRINRTKHCDSESFTLQKKSFLGFWYNPNNIDAYTTGVYSTLQDARNAYIRKVTPESVSYINPALAPSSPEPT